ncbi:SUA5 Putative translation factor (SUA5) [Burkholderiaceae bacterium]
MVKTSSDAVLQAAHVLSQGGLIGLPTETVYGLAADALNPQAVSAIFQAKGRPADHPLIVHVVDAAQVALFAQDVPEFAVHLMTAFWPGPLTLILPKKSGVADAAAGGHQTIALRCPAHPMAQAVLQAAQSLGVQGVAAPSANLFGSVSPTTAAHVREAFPSLLVLDGGACDVGIESTIVDCSRGAPVLLRPGMLSLSQLSQACGVAVLNSTSLETTSATSADALNEQTPAAPGSLASHYAPRARLRLLSADEMLSRLPRVAVQVALWTRSVLDVPAGVWWVKMPSDAAQCAHELFAQLRAMDAKGVQEIWVETPPEGEAWDGVRDRLQRAAALK